VQCLQISNANRSVQAPRVGKDYLAVTSIHELFTSVAVATTTFIFFGQE
jgi:hypothetical protein